MAARADAGVWVSGAVPCPVPLALFWGHGSPISNTRRGCACPGHSPGPQPNRRQADAERARQRRIVRRIPEQNVAPLNVPPSVSHAALALSGLPPYPGPQVNGAAASSTATVQPSSSLPHSAPSLNVPLGSVQLFAEQETAEGADHSMPRWRH